MPHQLTRALRVVIAWGLAPCLMLFLTACQTTDVTRDGFVERCKARGHMEGEAALEQCVAELRKWEGEPWAAKTGSCVAFCNR